MYYLSRSPYSTPTHQRAISPRSRPTESGSARASFRLRFARYRLVIWLRSGGSPHQTKDQDCRLPSVGGFQNPPFGFGEDRQEDRERKEDLGD